VFLGNNLLTFCVIKLRKFIWKYSFGKDRILIIYDIVISLDFDEIFQFFKGFFCKVLAICILCSLFITLTNFHIRVSYDKYMYGYGALVE